NDPQAELILRQLGLSSAISTGNGDGFFVVDTNDGGNKANSYVTEKQTDYVTLLPDGGALHHLQISVTYVKNGPVYEGTEQQEDYVDMQRTYLPGNATILGYSGFVPPGTFGLPPPNGCAAAAAIFDTSCDPAHLFTSPTTASDVPGRTMVFGSLWLSCGGAIDPTHPVETVQDFKHLLSGNSRVLGYDFQTCYTAPITRTQNIYIEWYTPNAFTIDASGHGTYTELVEKQAGSGDFLLGVGDYLTVYVDTSQLHARNPNVSTDPIVTVDDWNALIAGKKPFINHQQIQSNTTVTFGF
ncbi:MAG TPA: hypothetical protein VGS80_14240, partial [Ktedonobacterales bacterium]|nr:hypothetical protein [Ktedonobacterales bacterium]